MWMLWNIFKIIENLYCNEFQSLVVTIKVSLTRYTTRFARASLSCTDQALLQSRAGAARLSHKQEVEGSIPSSATILRGCSSVGQNPALIKQ